MRMRTIIAALRAWLKSLWFSAGNAASPADPAASQPITEHLRATPDDAILAPNQPQAGVDPREASRERNGPSSDLPESGPLEDEPRPAESSFESTEPASDPSPSEEEPPHSISDADYVRSPTPEEDEPDESSTTALPTTSDGSQIPRETCEKPESDNSDGIAEGNTGAASPQRMKHRPHQAGGRRGRQAGNPEQKRRQSPYFRPELICQRIPDSGCWEVILSAEEECQIVAVHLEGKPLDFTDRQCRVPLLNGYLTVFIQDGQEQVVSLFEGKPLIFKLRENWDGRGRRTTGIVRGYYIVIAPIEWERTGHAPVEADGCVDLGFQAHYFHRDATALDEGVDGFREWQDSSIVDGIELTGQRVFDASNDGELFVGVPPNLNTSPNIVRALVGEEGEDGWREDFWPHRQSLPEVLDGREGWFFLRVYDSEMNMFDSVAFRHLTDLRRIHVNEAEYTQDTVLVPASTGYSPAVVRFVDTEGSMLFPVLPVGACQTALSSGAIEIPPCPAADRMTCRLGSDKRGVNIALVLPRVWWRLEDGNFDPVAWRDTPLVMTREEFRSHSDSNAALSLLSKQQTLVRVGFDDEPGLPYRRSIKDDRIAIPLVDFVDYVQIDRRLIDDTCLKVEWAREIVPLIVVSADPLPEVVLFTARPATIVAGKEAVLEWMTRNSSDARVTIEPDVGVVETNGKRIIRPVETTKYALTLSVFGASDISSAVAITVVSPSTPDGSRASRAMFAAGGRRTGRRKQGRRPYRRALVKSAACGWRTGKGFSSREIRKAGLTVKEAADRCIPVDRRRRSLHCVNVERIRSILDA